jgi:hypothetical protein
MWPLLINGILCDEEEKGKKLFNLKLKLSRLELEKNILRLTYDRYFA